MTPLLNEKICAVARIDDPNLPLGALTIQDLQGVPLILTGVLTAGVRLALDRAACLAGVVLDVVVEVETATVAAQLVKDGVGWTIHYAAAVASEIDAGSLRAVPVEGLVLRRYLAQPALRSPSKATISMISLLQETVASLIRDGHWPMAELSG